MSRYLFPNISKYLNYEHFKKIYESDDDWIRSLDKTIEKPSFEELYQDKLLMVVAEPGYGKTRLLKEIVLQAKANNKKAFFVDAKKITHTIKDALNVCKLLDNDISEEELQKKLLFKSDESSEFDEQTFICYLS